MPQSRWTKTKIHLHRNRLHKTSDIPPATAVDDSYEALSEHIDDLALEASKIIEALAAKDQDTADYAADLAPSRGREKG
jgi:hypothetical protein